MRAQPTTLSPQEEELLVSATPPAGPEQNGTTAESARTQERPLERAGFPFPDAAGAFGLCVLPLGLFLLSELSQLEHVQCAAGVCRPGQLRGDRPKPGILVGPEEHGSLYSGDGAAQHGPLARHRVLPEQEAGREEVSAHGVLRAGGHVVRCRRRHLALGL